MSERTYPEPCDHRFEVIELRFFSAHEMRCRYCGLIEEIPA